MTQPLCCKSIRDMQRRILRQVGNEDNLLKCNEVNCVDKKWCEMPLIETLRVEHRLVRLRSACTVKRSATNPKELTIRNECVMCVVHRTFDGGNGLGHVVEA